MAIHGIHPVSASATQRHDVSALTIDQIKATGRLLDIIGSHPSMIKVFEQLLLWAPTSANVLITGETGCGKELVAQALHSLSPRAKRPFVVLDCSTLSKELLESELFGHEKGAFTGAYNLHLGRFERANGGTLFLDEMSNMSMEVQAKLLRVLQSRTFERIGGNREIRVDVRVVAASNRSLFKCVEEGTFRQDLLYRLNTGLIELPSLRERASDIPLLATSFLESFRQQYMREDIKGFAPEALLALTRYSWPGNVRELRNVVERCIILAKTPKIPLELLPRHIIDPTQAPDNLTRPQTISLSKHQDRKHYTAAVPTVSLPQQNNLPEQPTPEGQLQLQQTSYYPIFETEPPNGVKRYEHEMQFFEKKLILAALQRNENNLSKTASFLGLTKATLQKKMLQLALDLPQQAP